MIVYRDWCRMGKRMDRGKVVPCEYYWRGWFLFGVIPLMLKRS